MTASPQVPRARAHPSSTALTRPVSFGSELLKVDLLANTHEWNRQLDASVDAAAEYMQLWTFGD